ncbi:hypothetical protein JXB02_05585 [Candidatus Woesearchaeota archaeon]|nr:hypothetical protein [Candidatus Woesearchaeota archaeon]
MARTPTKDEIDSLELQADQAFEAFERARMTQSRMDGEYASKVYGALGDTLRKTTGEHSFKSWRRGTKKAQPFDRYLLQYAIGSHPSTAIAEVAQIRDAGVNHPPRKTKETYDSLHKAVQANRDYATITAKVRELADAQRFSDIAAMLATVRETYAKPNLAK